MQLVTANDLRSYCRKADHIILYQIISDHVAANDLRSYCRSYCSSFVSLCLNSKLRLRHSVAKSLLSYKFERVRCCVATFLSVIKTCILIFPRIWGKLLNKEFATVTQTLSFSELGSGTQATFFTCCLLSGSVLFVPACITISSVDCSIYILSAEPC